MGNSVKSVDNHISDLVSIKDETERWRQFYKIQASGSVSDDDLKKIMSGVDRALKLKSYSDDRNARASARSIAGSGKFRGVIGNK